MDCCRSMKYKVPNHSQILNKKNFGESSVTEQPRKFYVRFSNIEDHEKIMEFYTKNPHKNVAGRHEDLMRDLADKGSITLIEDAKTGEIVGASISYPMNGLNGTVEIEKWLEVGTTRMSLNGYPGLFDVMITMQVLRAFLVEPPEDRFVCQMESPMVQKMAMRLGWRPYTPSKELVDVSDKTLDLEPGDTYGYDNWYSAGAEALPVMAKLMKDTIDKPCLEHAKTGARIELDFSKSKFFKLFEDEIRHLAGRDFGPVDEPDYTQSVAKRRQDWMRWYFK